MHVYGKYERPYGPIKVAALRWSLHLNFVEIICRIPVHFSDSFLAPRPLEVYSTLLQNSIISYYCQKGKVEIFYDKSTWCTEVKVYCTNQYQWSIHDICFVLKSEREVKTLRISTQHKPDWRPLTDDINTRLLIGQSSAHLASDWLMGVLTLGLTPGDLSHAG